MRRLLKKYSQCGSLELSNRIAEDIKSEFRYIGSEAASVNLMVLSRIQTKSNKNAFKV